MLVDTRSSGNIIFSVSLERDENKERENGEYTSQFDGIFKRTSFYSGDYLPSIQEKVFKKSFKGKDFYFLKFLDL